MYIYMPLGLFWNSQLHETHSWSFTLLFGFFCGVIPLPSKNSTKTTTTTTTHEQRVCTRELNNFLRFFFGISIFLTWRGHAHICKHKCAHLSTLPTTTKNGTKKKKNNNNSNKVPGSLLSTPLHYAPLFLRQTNPGRDKAQQGVEHTSKRTSKTPAKTLV